MDLDRLYRIETAHYRPAIAKQEADEILRRYAMDKLRNWLRNLLGLNRRLPDSYAETR